MDVDTSPECRKDVKKHALLVSVTLHAHVAGILKYAIEMAQRGVKITFVGMEKDVSKLRTDEEVKGLDINLISFEDYPSSQQIVSSPGFNVFSFVASARELFQPVLDMLLADKQAGRPGPTCIVGDRLLPLSLDAAKLLEIPLYQFYSCGANFARILQAYPPLFADGTLTMRPALLEPGGDKGRVVNSLTEFEGELNVDGFPPLRFPYMLDGFFGMEHILEAGHVVQQADALIVNTFYEMEAPIIESIRQCRKEQVPGKALKIFLVGPLSTPATVKVNLCFETNARRLESNMSLWLDSQAPASVLYICFGTIAGNLVDPEQILEIARALEASDQAFLWALSIPPSPVNLTLQDVLPPGFEERTKGRGLISTGWVAQYEILSHSSIGAFLTHSGWNSVLEAVCVGVPMIAWPQISNDQGLITRHIVDVLKIAVEVGANSHCCDPRNSEDVIVIPRRRKLVGHVELEKAIRFIMSEEGSALRSRVQELKRISAAAAADGGAKKKALDDLVEFIPGVADL
ncbi:hypothetical protein Mapa_004788 [Marchantia paleacea]|nr:hypothetical protein Mapa_004788 [Marchantia paleacea]